MGAFTSTDVKWDSGGPEGHLFPLEERAILDT
jgi:hypothetical protein